MPKRKGVIKNDQVWNLLQGFYIGVNLSGRSLMSQPMRNVDGSPIKDAEEKKLGCLIPLFCILLIPIFFLGKLFEKIRRGRYWRMSDRDYEILRRKRQRKKAK